MIEEATGSLLSSFIDNFWKRLEEAEGTVIQVEGQQTTKEKQNNPPEGTGAIGETLG